MALPASTGRALRIKMAKFDNEFNAEIRTTINSFNQKIRRAEKRGEKGLPSLRSVREFKAQFATKKDAKRELAQLRTMLNNKQALERRRTADGTISNWEFDYITKNLRSTDKWIAREIEKERLKMRDYPDHLYATREKINRLIDERDIIHRQLNTLTTDALKTVESVIQKYKRKDLKTIAGREYFMKNLDALLQAQGVSLKERQEMYKKFEDMSNEEFEELYRRHDVITDIMLLIDSPTGGEGLSNKDRFERAEQALKDEELANNVNLIKENYETYIEEAKTAVNEANMLFDASNQEYVSYREYEKRAKSLNNKGIFKKI